MPESLRSIDDPRDPRLSAAGKGLPDDDAIERYLAFLSNGYLFVDPRGRVIGCTPNAERILRALDPHLAPASAPQDFLRALAGHTGTSFEETAALARADGPGGLRHHEIEILVEGRTIEVKLHPVADGGWAITFEDVSLRRATEADTAAMARLDVLTKLPNRLMLRERLDEALARLQRMGEGCALLLIDLDRFKPINDTLGHPAGDALLEKVADRLRTTVRPTDTVARLGGDEFVIIQSAVTGVASTEALARRLIDLLGRTYIIEGQLLSIGASVGIALAPGDGVDADKLLKQADLALYQAKLGGRGTYRFFEPSMDALMQERRQLELDMRQALARREFELHYQPQLDLKNDELVGCEALIRWVHPQRGPIPPLDFIPLAEDIGLIIPIGEWVIRQACRDAASWPLPLSVAVNVSPAQFKSERLVETIVSALASSGLPATRLEIEITEGVLLHENETTLRTLHRMRDLGVRVSMDDFGTGYSSLSYLRSFPFDKIKIDRSFVKDMQNKPEGDAIIRAVSGLGRSLGMTTIAEGVETPEQMARIRAEGCTEIQGYLISKPVPLHELPAPPGEAEQGPSGVDAMSDLYRLVYASKNLIAGDEDEAAAAIAQILSTSQRNNAAVDVTGALLFNKGAFGAGAGGTTTGRRGDLRAHPAG